MNNNNNLGLSYSARKALTVHIGEAAGNEIANLIQRMAAQIDELKRSKVSVTRSLLAASVWRITLHLPSRANHSNLG